MKQTLLAAALCAGLMPVISHAETRSPGTIISQAGAKEWRSVSPDNLVVITLETGQVLVELNPSLAPAHTENFRKLVRQGFYDRLSVYRFVEGFVAQGGDMDGKKVVTGDAKRALKAEFYLATEKPVSLELDLGADGYAPHNGFLHGFAVAQNAEQSETWQVHCPGTFAMARDNNVDSGGTEFYAVIGQGPRYLDRNITAFGQVLSGMAALQTLSRQPEKGKAYNPIVSMRMAADLPEQERPTMEVMRTDSESFRALVASRRNRPESWFVETPNYVDVCGVAVPSRATGG